MVIMKSPTMGNDVPAESIINIIAIAVVEHIVVLVYVGISFVLRFPLGIYRPLAQ